MAALAYLCSLFIFVSVFPLHIHRARGVGEQICDSISCGEIDIQFPFGLKGANRSRSCSYPGFQLSCDKHSRTILSLPYSGDLIVKSINYVDQTIQVNDLNGCLPKLFLHRLNFSGSPFMFDSTLYEFYNLTFLRCPSNITDSYPLPPISCLGSHEGNRNSNSSSAVLFSWFLRSLASSSSFETCEVMSSAIVPISNMAMWPFWPDLTSDIELTWGNPRCGGCAARGRVCGFAKDASLQVGCFPDPNQTPGLPRSAKYGLALGVGIPGLLCIMGLSCFICCKFRMFTNRHRPSTELPTSIIALQPAPLVMGLDGPSIEKYPKTLIGDSGRLPRPNDNTCPICLSEYEPKETLRTIPECNHYFHAHCIDAWLKMNATCPLCRNSPDASSTVTPSSSSSSSLSPSSSLSSSP